MKKYLLAMAVVGMMVATVGCGGGKKAEATPATTKAETTKAETTKAETEAEAEGEIVQVPVTIINGTGVDIHILEMSGGGLDEWGDDLLGDQVMAHGTYTELNINVDSANLLWDIRVTDGDDNSLEWYDIDISEMPSDGFGIELLWDGSEGTANVMSDPSQMEGDYSEAELEAEADVEVEADAEAEISVADASSALAGTVWMDDADVVYGFGEDNATLYLSFPDGTELEGVYALAADASGVVALSLVVPDADMEINAVLTDITETSLEFTDIATGEAAVLVPVEE